MSELFILLLLLSVDTVGLVMEGHLACENLCHLSQWFFSGTNKKKKIEANFGSPENKQSLKHHDSSVTLIGTYNS